MRKETDEFFFFLLLLLFYYSHHILPKNNPLTSKKHIIFLENLGWVLGSFCFFSFIHISSLSLNM